MMVKKKIVSLIMVIAMLLTVVSVIPSAFSAENADLADTAAALDYNLSSNIQSGNILHAFDWRMSDLVRYAPEIAAAGYSAVQISPIQQTKVTANDGSFATDWWSFYQPTDMKIGNALGSADDLKAATAELHKYGIKVIADVVTNHTQDSSGDKKIAANISSALKSFLRHSPTGKHTSATDNTRATMTQNDMNGKLTDINTGSKDYQNYVINNLLIPLINNGVDGFRFDAAKHIETPDDGDCASDYWPTVTSAIKNAKSDAYIYGEVLSLANKLSVTSYTKYMSVTDYAFGDTVRAALNNKNASNLVNYGYTGSQKKDNVLWVESHDTFCDNKSTDLTKKQQILGWAAIGARADAPALFFVRPKHEELDAVGFIKYDELMGAPGAADTWKDPTVVAVNRFKNAFIGQNESVSAGGANLFVQRGTTGMVIVNLNGSSTSISQSCSMASGSYKDQVSGATFQVSGGKITGTVGSTGVAVIYNLTTANSAPTISLKLDGTELNAETLNRYTAATATIDVEITNATSASIKVSNLSAKSVSAGKTSFKLNSSIPYGKSIDITVSASNGSKNVSRTYNIKKKDATETKKVYFDNSIMKWPGIWVYCKTGEAASTQIAKYDEYKLTGDLNGIMSYTVPANTNYVKFNEGYIGPEYTDKSHTDEYGRCHLLHTFNECQGYCGRTMPETVVNYGTANEKANREKGGYKLVGAMILRNLRFEDYGEYPVATLTASDTTLSGSEAPTEKPTSAPPTQKPTEAPTDPSGSATARMGDADNDGKVTIVDATRIQRVLAGLAAKSPYYDIVADVDQDTKVTIVDATVIQRWLAGLKNQKEKINVLVNVGGGTAPTEEPTYPEPTWEDDPTEAPYNPVTGPLPNRYVALIYCEAFSTDPASRTIEKEFDKSTGTLTFDFPADSYVFVRNYDTGIQYCTDGWSYYANPVTLVNQNSLANESDFEKMYVPAGTHTLYLSVDSASDTCTLGYGGGSGTPVVTPTTGGLDPVTDSDILFIPGAGSEADPAWYAWVWNDGENGVWIKGVKSGDNIIFPGAADYTDMLVARMPSGATSASWETCWNQSEDIKIQPGKTLAFKSWGSGNKFLIEWK